VDDYRRKVTAISARMPSARDARLLRQPGNRPVLVAEALNVDTAGRPIEYCITRFASDRIQIVMES
jgi:GntR family phosphonate transport system transcriptional regulator